MAKKRMVRRNSKKLGNLLVAISVCLGLVGMANFALKAQADSLSAGPLTITYTGSGPIFNEVNIAPGATFNKDITVTNDGSVAHSFALATDNVSGDLADKVYLEPVGGEVWKMSIKELSEIPTVSKTVVSSIAPGASAAITLKAEFDTAADNAYQNKGVSFDLVFGSQEAEPTPVSSPSPSPVAVASPTVDAIGGGYLAFAPLPAIVSPAPSALASPSPEGEVKGAGEEKETGKSWPLLLIVPAVAIASLLIPLGSRTGIRTPIVAGAVAAILSYFYKGTLEPWIFWLILIVEVIVILVAGWFIVSRYRTRKAREKRAASRKKR
ncbi:MAG: CalY family protein [Candidatus Berkelbacteria bacterium]|nr:CalY family protein [Candidatus Berkelbacteria bacterium]